MQDRDHGEGETKPTREDPHNSHLLAGAEGAVTQRLQSLKHLPGGLCRFGDMVRKGMGGDKPLSSAHKAVGGLYLEPSPPAPARKAAPQGQGKQVARAAALPEYSPSFPGHLQSLLGQR